MLYEASEAISLVSGPFFSNDLLKICCAASSCDAMIMASTKALTLAWFGEEGCDEWQEGRWRAGAHSYKCLEMDPAQNN